MNVFRFLFCFFSLALVFAACENEIEVLEDVDDNENFYPLELGKYWVYQMDSIIFDNEGRDRYETTSFIREEIVEILNPDELPRYVIEVSYKNNIDAEWSFLKNWSVYVEDNKLIRNEDNLRFIKLIYPITTGVSWDGNSFIDSRTEVLVSGEALAMFKNYWDYKFLDRQESELIGIQTYDDVLTIQQSDDENDLEIRISNEKYAKDVGMISRHLQILDTQCTSDCDGFDWVDKAHYGFILDQTLIEHN